MEEIIEKPLTPQQRMKRGRIMKRLAKRIQRAKERKMKKLANRETLEKRAQKKAKEAARQKIMGKDKSYKDLSFSQKVTVDKLVSKRFSSGRLAKMAKKLMPRVRKAEQERLLKYKASQSQSGQVDAEEQVNYQTMFIETGGAGRWGMPELTNRYKKDTPGQGMKEGKNEDSAKDRIRREKESDKRKHDAMMDRARTADTREKNMKTEGKKTFKDMFKEKKQGDPCWKGYQQVGMKDKNGKKVPNCVPEEDEKV